MNKEIDQRKRKVTDLKGNSKIYLPKPLAANKEANISLRRDRYHEIFHKYKQENCNKSGEQKSNLTFQQRKGLKKLSKRIRDREIFLMLTDKSGKFAVVSPEIYLKMGLVHTKKDKQISWEKVNELQREQNGHCSMWLKMSNMGENFQHEARLRETCLNKSCNVSSFHLMLKDHKKVAIGDLPQTRPLCNGSGGMGVHFNNILSDYVEAIADCMEGTIEVISTEDFLSKVNKYNDEIDRAGENSENEIEQEEKEVVITGADAKALFPSLLMAHTARLVRDEAKRTKLKVKGLNYMEVARYVAMGYQPWEVKALGLHNIVPYRRYNHGSRPNVTGKEPLSKEANDEVRWIFPPREPTEIEKVNLWAAALEIGIKRCFATHTYQFGGKLFQQIEGGPIGMRLTGACARVVMGVWGRTVNEILEHEKIENHLAAAYVDDVRYITSVIAKGWRWQDKEKRFEYSEIWEAEDSLSGESENLRTSNELLKVMNSVFAHIQFTKEIPEDFSNGRLPTLDFAMWLEGEDRAEKGDSTSTGENRECRRRKILFSFYEKEIKFVLWRRQR